MPTLIRSVKNEAEHETALKRLEELMISDPVAGSVAEDEMELLALLIQDYEKRTFNIPIATPAEVEAWNLSLKDFNP